MGVDAGRIVSSPEGRWPGLVNVFMLKNSSFFINSLFATLRYWDGPTEWGLP